METDAHMKESGTLYEPGQPGFPAENPHVREVASLLPPCDIKTLCPATSESIETVMKARETITTILNSPSSGKLVVVVGPCSIHDPDAAIEYAAWLKQKREEYGDRLELVMRAYFEKPRTTVGWKGLINDPFLDESFDINTGLIIARKLVCDITKLGVPIGTELLDTTSPQYTAGLMSWGAVGARTTESQLHRELASGLSFAVGFKNGTDGNVNIAIDAMKAAAHQHRFFGITDEGRTAIVSTNGNPDCHIILRGGSGGTNYDAVSIAEVAAKLSVAKRVPRIMVDCSHGNSLKDFRKQRIVAENLARQVTDGATSIMGVMIESNLAEGAQSLKPGAALEYGKSITDGCVGLEETDLMFSMLYDALRHNADTGLSRLQ